MKYAQRSTAAVVAATLVGGTGIAAVVTGVANAASHDSSTHVVDASQRQALSAALHDLLASSRQIDDRLIQAKRDLARQTRELRQQRALAHTPMLTPTTSPSTTSTDDESDDSDEPDSDEPDDDSDDSTTPPTTEPTPPPPTDTSTGASGGDDEPGDDGGDDNGGDNSTGGVPSTDD